MAADLRFLGAVSPLTGDGAPFPWPVRNADVVVLRLSQDFNVENAQFTVRFDGVPVLPASGGPFVVSAIRGLGQHQDFGFAGDFGDGPHSVEINFLNDRSGGIGGADSNLVVERIFFDGALVLGQSVAQLLSGPRSYVLSVLPDLPDLPGPPAVPGLPAPPAAADTLLLRMTQDYYVEDARFVVRVDGVQQGGVNTVTARRGDAAQDFTFAGDFGAGSHRVSVDFLNDHYAPGVPGGDSNLVVVEARFNDALVVGAPAIQFGPGAREFVVPPPAREFVVPPPAREFVVPATARETVVPPPAREAVAASNSPAGEIVIPAKVADVTGPLPGDGGPLSALPADHAGAGVAAIPATDASAAWHL